MPHSIKHKRQRPIMHSGRTMPRYTEPGMVRCTPDIPRLRIVRGVEITVSNYVEGINLLRLRSANQHRNRRRRKNPNHPRSLHEMLIPLTPYPPPRFKPTYVTMQPCNPVTNPRPVAPKPDGAGSLFLPRLLDKCSAPHQTA